MQDLYTQSSAQAFGLERGQFSAILSEIVQKYLPGETSSHAAGEFCRSLRVEELALARACAAG
ncbi:MAG: hypothetical protein DMG90_08270 [Acidobacteria bacterium]|nr:MAG: hypothetical protein DMG90_08270 [Acidobacteriota bacterium]